MKREAGRLHRDLTGWCSIHPTGQAVYLLLMFSVWIQVCSGVAGESPPTPPLPHQAGEISGKVDPSSPQQAGGEPEKAVSPLTPARLLDAAVKGGEYLLRHQAPDGRFAYQYNAQRNRFSSSYNLVRHAGTTYALTLLYEVTENPRFLLGARKGVKLLLANTRGPDHTDASAEFECVVTNDGEEGNLGGTALGVLALLEYATASGDQSMRIRANQLGEFLLHQQDSDGRFRSKFSFVSSDQDDFESIYYPGEAVLALVRLYQTDRNTRWLTASEKGAGWLMDVRDATHTLAELPHDHWLLMGLNELYAVTRNVRYYNQGIRIGASILLAQRKNPQPASWIGSFGVPPRSAPAATRCEGLVAAYFLSLEGGTPNKEYVEALMLALEFVLRCQITPEVAATLPDPNRAAGGFRESPDGWNIRMDFVQHAICALLGLREIQME